MYQASLRMIDGRRPRTGSSYSAVPKCSASSRSMTRSSVRPSAIRTRRSPSIWASPSGRVGSEHGQERLLRDLDRADPLHPALALPLLLEQLPLPGDVATVTLGQHVLAHRAHGFSRNDV